MRRAGGLVVLLLALIGNSADAACVVAPRAVVPLEVVGGSILVNAVINDRPATMILDTGAQRSVVTPSAIARFELAQDEWVATTMRGIGGIERRRNALPRNFSLGGIALARRTVSRDTSLTVATLAHEEAGGRRIDGLLGRDFLSLFDLVLDMAARRVELFMVEGCSGNFLPWTAPYAALPVQNPADTALSVMVELDGVSLRALLDTGASTTLLAAPGMGRLGLAEEALARDPTRALGGLGARAVVAHQHGFGRLRIGGETTERPRIWVAPVRPTPVADMLLGADWLATRLVWISFATKQVFVGAR